VTDVALSQSQTHAARWRAMMNGVQTKSVMATFTVTKKGNTIEFDSVFSELEDALNYIEVNVYQNDFVRSLLTAKHLSDRQASWVHYLATQSVIDSQTPVTFGPYKQLVNKMYDAGAYRSTKFQVRLPGVTLSTVTKGVNVGCVYLYENKNYVGKITSIGELVGDVSEDIQNLLEDANENLLQLAKLFGHSTGQCSICGRELSDKISIERGIGPICEQRLKNVN
jgi:hypothetical protein